eukprot:14057102-Alexandrium_andersonii.AAC.1
MSGLAPGLPGVIPVQPRACPGRPGSVRTVRTQSGLSPGSVQSPESAPRACSEQVRFSPDSGRVQPGRSPGSIRPPPVSVWTCPESVRFSFDVVWFNPDTARAQSESCLGPVQ